MAQQRGAAAEGLLAVRALVGPLAGVHAHVDLQRHPLSFPPDCPLALTASPLARLTHLQEEGHGEGLRALGALVGLLPRVDSQVIPEGGARLYVDEKKKLF